MPKFHFHSAAEKDEVGKELANLEEAKAVAVKLAGLMICDRAGGFWQTASWSMTVTDEAGHTLLHLQLVGTET